MRDSPWKYSSDFKFLLCNSPKVLDEEQEKMSFAKM